jgi:hypothetical protein
MTAACDAKPAAAGLAAEQHTGKHVHLCTTLSCFKLKGLAKARTDLNL